MPKMPIASFIHLPAGITTDLLARNAHSSIEWSIDSWGAIAVQIEESSVAYLEDAMFDDILLRAGGKLAYSFEVRTANSQYAKLELLDPFWNIINYLLFHGIRSGH